MSAAADDELVFLPLGGSGEIGMNLNAYGYGPPDDKKWIIVDIGVTFASETPGIEVIMPDPTFLEERRGDILGIILTHAHEDHIGAIGWLWPRLRVPVYATPFTAALVREKLKEHSLLDKTPLKEVPLGGKVSLGPFDIEYVTLTHSIPEPNGLAIRTPLGLIWHTGDWKIDPDPLIGAVTDEKALKRLADEGVLAMVCDSTNVFEEGHAGSEADVREALVKLIGGLKGRVAVTAFASNVARVESVIRAAEACGRAVCLVGRSMHKVTAAAQSVGLLKDLRPFLGEEEASDVSDNRILYLCTGSQGESRAALARIAAGTHRFVQLGEGDSVVFSSRIIPGNDIAIYALYNALVDKGIAVISDGVKNVHVSGHPCRDELRQMYQWARPRIAIPVHGERRHLVEHVKLARELQVAEAIAPRNGDIIRLAPGKAEIIDEAPAGRLCVDGVTLVDCDDEALKERRKLGADGAISVGLVVHEKKHSIMSGPEVRVRGLSMQDERALDLAIEELAEAAETGFGRLNHTDRADDDLAEQAIARIVRKTAERIWGKRPLVDVVLMRV